MDDLHSAKIPTPPWIRDWRCPHCGSPAKSFEQNTQLATTDMFVEDGGELGDDPTNEKDTTCTFICEQGHVRHIVGRYGNFEIPPGYEPRGLL